MEIQSDFLTANEVSSLLRKSVKTIWAWKAAGILPYYRIGGSILFKRSEIEQALKAHNHVGGPVAA